MAPPATKRRKLSHSSAESDSDNDSFASFPSEDQPNGQSESNDAPEDSGHEEIEGSEDDNEDGGLEDAGEGDMDVDDESSEEEDASDKPKLSKSKAAPRKTGNGNGTTYNGEVFKSNLFKLQVDELLDQVRPAHTRKNDSVESAVRTLKTIIEEIPARKPASVCWKHHLG